MSTADELIKQGIAKAKAGNKAEAKELFTQAVKQDPQNANAWYFLSQVVENREQAIYCLEKVLQFQPENLKAAEILQKLKVRTTLSQPDKNQPPQQVVIVKEKPKNKLVSFLAALGLLAVICICIGIASNVILGDTGGVGTGGTGGIRTTYEVIYKLTGSAYSASVTYNNAQDNTEQRDPVKIPWELKFTGTPGLFLYVSAQNNSEYGSITCEIWVDGKLQQIATSRGAYTIATCDMRLP